MVGSMTSAWTYVLLRPALTACQPSPPVGALKRAAVVRPGVECAGRRGIDGERDDVTAAQAGIDCLPVAAAVRALEGAANHPSAGRH